MRIIIAIFLLLSVPASGQMYLNDHTQRFIGAARDAGYTMREKDYNALIRFSEKVFQTGTTTGYDTTGATMVYNYTECGHNMVGLYPVIGNALTCQALNLVAAGTSTVAPVYYGTFVGSPTAGDGQVPWNGTTQYFRSNIPMSAFNGYTTISLSYYSYTNNAAAGMFEVGTNVAPTLGIFVRNPGNLFFGLTKGTGLASVTTLRADGFRIVNRTNADSTQFYNNIQHLGTVAAPRSSSNFSTFPITMGAGTTNLLSVNVFSTRTWAGSHAGPGLTYAQAFSLGAAFIDLKYRK